MAQEYPTSAYEGASKTYRLAHKGLRQGGQDELAARELQFLRARSQNLIRNNGAARSAQMKSVANWVGAGIIGKWSDPRLQKLWQEFSADPNVDGYGSLGNLQAVWGNALIESGEVLTRMVVKRRSGHTLPLALQTFEADQLDVSYQKKPRTAFGISFDKFNAPITYHLLKRHPSTVFSLLNVGQQNPHVNIPAKDILHLFERGRPGQWRGIPMFAPIIATLYEMDELSDATLVRQKAAQAIGWIIKKTSAGALPTMGAVADATVADALGTSEGEDTPPKIQKVTPGGIHYLNEDEDFTFASVQDIGDNYTNLLKQYWRTIASALGLTYEQLTGDLSDVNFSSIRAGLIEFRKRLLQVQMLIFVNRGLQPLAERFKEFASLYTAGNYDSATVKWIMPKLPGVDQYKDTLSDVAEIRAGLSTLEEKLAERQSDFDVTIEQLAKEQGLDLVLDSNPVHNTKDVVKVADASQSADGSANAAKAKGSNNEL